MSQSPPRKPLPAGHVPRMRYRPLAQRDLAECMAMLPEWIALDALTRRALPDLFSQLLPGPMLISGVMEDVALAPGSRIQGWGVSMILPATVVQELALDLAPRSDTTARLYASLRDGSCKPMTDREIGIANARGELALIILHYSMLYSDLRDPYVHSVIANANDAFRMFHDGYNLRTIFYTTCAAAEPIAATSGFRPRPFVDADRIRDLPAELRPVFLGLTREEAKAQLPGAPARACFESKPPLFRFSASQRSLLWYALFDETDEALLPALDVSVHGLKKLWRGIYERIEDVSADFFGEATGEDDGKRGPEKRRQVLAYVRQRPEELRPWYGEGK